MDIEQEPLQVFVKNPTRDDESRPRTQSAKVIQTAGGNIHYVQKQVAFGLHSVPETPQSQISEEHNEDVEHDLTRKYRRRKMGRSKSDSNMALHRTNDQIALSQQLPSRGELRHVYLDMKWARFGFRLKNYSRKSEKMKIQQTIVESVTAGSPAFMAGLHPGDCILEVNGIDMRSATGDEVVSAIMKTTEKRVQLLVEFVDGVRRMELKKRLIETQARLAEKQQRLWVLLSTKHCLTSYPVETNNTTSANDRFSTSSNEYITIQQGISDVNYSFISNRKKSVDEDSLMAMSPSSSINEHTSSCQSNIVVYTGDIRHLSCDVLVIPIDKSSPEINDCSSNVISVLLHAGGDKLMNEIALAKHCDLGNIIVTSAGEMKGVKYIYHCVFGHFEEHIKLCCYAAFEKGLQSGAISIVFWLDAFVYSQVPPMLLLEIIKSLQSRDELSLDHFGAIVIASQSLPGITELVQHVYS